MRERRQELANQALDYFLEHGVAGLSLRPIAAHLGTSARLLVYHFGSKEGLITAVMDEGRARIQKSFVQLMSDRAPGTTRLMPEFWTWAIHPKNIKCIRLLFEVQILAFQNPARYARYMEGSSSSWLKLIEESLPPAKESRAMATLCVAVIDGLLLEYLSTKDVRRTRQALDLFNHEIIDYRLRKRGA